MLLPDKKNFNYLIFWRTRRYLLLTIGLILVAVGLLVFGAYPQLQAALELRSEAQQKRPKLDQLERKLAQLENVRLQPEFEQLDVVNEALPSKKPLLELLTNLNAISLAHEVSINEFDLSPGEVATSAAELQQSSQSTGDVDTLEVAMAIQGDQSNVNQFLSSLEKISPFTTIIQLSINTSEQTGTPISTAELTTHTFFFTRPIETTVDSPLPVIADEESQVLNQLASFELPDLIEQTEVTGGGLEDLFGVDPLQFEQ